MDATFLKQSLSSGPEEVTKILQGRGHGRLVLMVCLCFAFIQLEIMSRDRPGEPSVQPVPLRLVFSQATAEGRENTEIGVVLWGQKDKCDQ